MEGIVVVSVIPVNRAGWHEPFLVRTRRIGKRLDGRLFDLRVLKLQLALFTDDVLATIGDEPLVEKGIGVAAVGRQLEAHSVDVAHPLLAQLLLHPFEEIVERIPRFWDVFDLIARLFDQRLPDVVGEYVDRVGNAVEAALFCDTVVAVDQRQRGVGVMLPLRLDDIAHIDELVVPSVQRSDLWRSVLEQVGDLAGGHSRHDLLPQRRIDRKSTRLNSSHPSISYAVFCLKKKKKITKENK